MWLSEQFLFLLAKLLYRSQIVLTNGMKGAISSMDKHDQYRSGRISFIMDAVNKYGIHINGKVLADFGCGAGAISRLYVEQGAERVIGIDVDRKAIQRARNLHASSNVSFCVSSVDRIPLENETVDVIISCDVFEHVARADTTLTECLRILRPGGKMLIGTWGWYHPFAAHLFATMPVPWAHVFFSERTVLRVCRRVYNSSWYIPAMYDLDENGDKQPDKYHQEEISDQYVNKLLIRDFEKLFRESGFRYNTQAVPFGSRYAKWTRVFLRTPWLREFVTGYFWAVLTKEQPQSRNTGRLDV